MAAMDGPNPALALQLLEQIRSQFPGSRRADRLTVHFIDAPSACACASHLHWNSRAHPHTLFARRRRLWSYRADHESRHLRILAHLIAGGAPAGGAAALAAGQLSAPARAALQGMFNEARGRMDEAQQWYEGTMEKAALDQGALKRQIAQVMRCSVV